MGQAIIVAGIVIAILTHKDNIFSAPEYSATADGKTWLHAGMHVVIGSLLWWGIGSVIMWVPKKVSSRDSSPATERA